MAASAGDVRSLIDMGWGTAEQYWTYGCLPNIVWFSPVCQVKIAAGTGIYGPFHL